MKIFIKKLVGETQLYWLLRKWSRELRQRQELSKWAKSGKPSPPPHIIKQKVIKAYAAKYQLKTLVETGTYLGDMLDAMKTSFDKIYSIELSDELFAKAKKRFRNTFNVEIIHGDSSNELAKLLTRITTPALFWLDGHYSGGATALGAIHTPIFQELEQIFDSPEKRHVIIIDDARCFGSDNQYPSIEMLTQYIRSKQPNSNVEIEFDSIRITPNAGNVEYL